MQDRVIILVEDDPNDEELTLRAFRKSNIGNRIVVLRDGAEALDYFFCRAAPTPAGRRPTSSRSCCSTSSCPRSTGSTSCARCAPTSGPA